LNHQFLHDDDSNRHQILLKVVCLIYGSYAFQIVSIGVLMRQLWPKELPMCFPMRKNICQKRLVDFWELQSWDWFTRLETMSKQDM